MIRYSRNFFAWLVGSLAGWLAGWLADPIILEARPGKVRGKYAAVSHLGKKRGVISTPNTNAHTHTQFIN